MPDDLIDNPVETVGTVTETIAVKVKSAVIALAVAAITLAPIGEAGADIFNLTPVINK